ncbi:hypothetical protein SUGI_1401520 [Cryptomeria japonica]|uniref:Xylanase inhibitor C-terminal domain-containing protein n=1 Tax=Cryptomeria japonica TaxID=3369 RepID=A0AAD3NSB8_CRYJA|nr:hypothetical protein SUGI_1401520 [Cryptomeria japonica]
MAATFRAAHSFGGIAFGCSFVVQGDDLEFSTALLFGSAAKLNGIGVQSTMVINNTVLPKLNGYYHLSVEGITLGNVSLNIPRGSFDIQANESGGFIIDSGTHYTVLPHAAFTAVVSVLDSVLWLPRANDSKAGLSVCYSSPYYDYIPDVNMTFHMLGADYVVDADGLYPDEELLTRKLSQARTDRLKIIFPALCVMWYMFTSVIEILV